MKDSKLKLAIVISSLEVGGAEKLVVDLINELREKLEVKLFIIKKDYNSIYDKKIRKAGIEVIYFNHKIKIFSLLVALKFKRALTRFSPNIIHSHLKASTYVYFYNFFNKSFKWIHTVHTKAKIDTKFIRRLFFRSLYNKKRIELVCVSKGVERTVIQLYKSPKTTVIENGVNLNDFQYKKMIEKEINLINVGRLEEVKNQEYLIKECSSLLMNRTINKLTIIGDGSKKEYLLAYVKKLKISEYVEFVFYTDKVNSYLNKSNIFILTSFYEGMPLAVIEALASGLIVIASEAARDVIKDEYNGFLIKLEESSLKNKLIDVINNLVSYDYIRVNAINSSRKYSINLTTSKYLKLYTEGLI